MVSKRKRSQFQLDVSLTPSARSGRLGARPGRCPGALGNRSLLRNLAASGLLLRGRGAVPVVQHLDGEDHVEGEAGNETVEDQLVVDFLESSKDAREGASEVVEDL